MRIVLLFSTKKCNSSCSRLVFKSTELSCYLNVYCLINVLFYTYCLKFCANFIPTLRDFRGGQSSILPQLFLSPSSTLRQSFTSPSSALRQSFISSSVVLHQLFVIPSSAPHLPFVSSSSALRQAFVSPSQALHQLFISSSSVFITYI